MQTEDLLKVKFVLVCALASEVESGRHIGIPLDQLMEAIGIMIPRRSRGYFIFGHSPHTTGLPTCGHRVPASTHRSPATRKRVLRIE